MTCYSNLAPVWQIILLILSQITVIVLTCSCVVSFRHRYRLHRQAGICTVLVLNVMLYVLLQLNSHIGTGEQILHWQIPWAIPIIATFLSLGYAVRIVLPELPKYRAINHTSIKESFDTLPSGVCFFNEDGLPVLCNSAMHNFSFAVCGRDVQYITDLQDCLCEGFVPIEGIVEDGNLFTLSDGRVWQLESRSFTYESGAVYTQFIALDVTDLQRKRVELTNETLELRRVQSDLKQLSANMMAVTREEEILNTKMRVHDEMGRCLMTARNYLKNNNAQAVPDSLAASWQRAVSMLKYNTESSDEDLLSQIRKTCEYVKLAFIQSGKLPQNEKVAYLLTCAVRECVTNAVRYAAATELYADFSEDENEASVTVTNSGNPPEKEIIEGGGLSTLRRRVERAGGRMTVQSLPRFRLTVSVPNRKEDVL